MHRRTLIFLSILCSSCHQKLQTKYKPTCISVHGCPALSPLPFCTATQLAASQPVQSAIRNRVQSEEAGRSMVVGTLVKAATVCTRLGCTDGSCCNKCGGSMGFELGAPIGNYNPVSKMKISGKGIECSGDDSAVCCTLAGGQVVVAEVSIVTHGTYQTAMYGPAYHATKTKVLCRVETPDAVLLGAPLRVPVPTYPSKSDCAARMDSSLSDEKLWGQLRSEPLGSLIGALFDNAVGCVGQEIINRGSAIAPVLRAAVHDDIKIRYEGSEHPTIDNSFVTTLGDAAIFFLSQVCQVPTELPFYGKRQKTSILEKFLRQTKIICDGQAIQHKE